MGEIAKLSLGQSYALRAGSHGDNEDGCKFNSLPSISFYFGPCGNLRILTM